MPRLLSSPPAAPDWPVLDREPDLAKAIRARLDVVFAQTKQRTLPSGWWSHAVSSAYLGLGWRFYARKALRDRAVAALRNGLRDHGLLK